MATFQAQSLSVYASIFAALAVISAASAGAGSLRAPGAAPEPARAMVIPVCEPNCLGAPSSTESNNRPEYDDIPYTGPQTDGAPSSTFENAAPADPSDVAGSPGSTFDTPVPYDANAPAGAGDDLFSTPAAPAEAAPFDPYEAWKAATPR
ncbi:MAG: hypothetical protein AB7S70_13045 [Hyphomicrobium sp.]